MIEYKTRENSLRLFKAQSVLIHSYKRDYTNGLSSSTTRSSRYGTKNYDNEEHSDEYKKIMGNTDKYLTMAKYTNNNEGNDVNKMMEEERRSKAYSKIIGAQTAQSLVISLLI